MWYEQPRIQFSSPVQWSSPQSSPQSSPVIRHNLHTQATLSILWRSLCWILSDSLLLHGWTIVEISAEFLLIDTAKYWLQWESTCIATLLSFSPASDYPLVCCPDIIQVSFEGRRQADISDLCTFPWAFLIIFIYFSVRLNWHNGSEWGSRTKLIYFTDYRRTLKVTQFQ